MNTSRVIAGEMNQLARRSSHYLGGLLGSLLIGFVCFPVYTRMFSVADYGMIDFAQKLVLFFAATSKLGQQNSALRFFDSVRFAKDPQAARSYYSTMFFGMALTTAAGVLLLLGGARVVSGATPFIAYVAGFVGAMVFLRGLESMLFSFLRIEERTKLYAFASVCLKAAGFVAVCILVSIFGPSARTYFLGIGAVEAVVVAVLLVDLLRRRVLSFRSFDSTLFRTGLAFGVPLILYEVATIVLDAGDRILVRHYLGADALGRYSVAYGLSTTLNDLLITPLNLALMPIYMRLWQTVGRERTVEFLSTALDVLLMVIVGVFCAAAVGVHDGVTLLASAKYAGLDRCILIVTAGLLIYTTHVFLTAGLLIHKKTVIMAKLLLLAAVTNVGLNCLLLPRLGIDAAAIATLVSYLLCIVLLGRSSFRLLRLDLNVRGFAKYCLAGATAWALASFLVIGSPVLNIAARGITVVGVYTGILYCVDSRVRAAFAYVLSQLKGGAAEAELQRSNVTVG